MVEPLGDGSTRRAGSGSAVRIVDGDRLICPGRAARRPTARTASCSAAHLAAAVVMPPVGQDGDPEVSGDAESGGEGQDVNDHCHVYVRRNRCSTCRSPVVAHAVARLLLGGVVHRRQDKRGHPANDRAATSARSGDNAACGVVKSDGVLARSHLRCGARPSDPVSAVFQGERCAQSSGRAAA